MRLQISASFWDGGGKEEALLFSILCEGRMSSAIPPVLVLKLVFRNPAALGPHSQVKCELCRALSVNSAPICSMTQFFHLTHPICPFPKSPSLSHSELLTIRRKICLRSLRVVYGWKGVCFASINLSVSFFSTGKDGEKPLRQ